MCNLAMSELNKTDTVIIKFGSNIIANAGPAWFATLAKDIKTLNDTGKKVIIVSSGAIALGLKRLALPEGSISDEQRLAAFMPGQIDLMNAYDLPLQEQGLFAGQGLLTHGSMDRKKTRANAINRLKALLELGGIPILNENDFLSTEEDEFGDNDGLATHLAAMLHRAEYFGKVSVVLFSTIDGFYRDNKNHAAGIYPVIYEITDEHRGAVKDINGPTQTRGGGNSKLDAAEACMKIGVPLVLTNGEKRHCVSALFNNATKRNTVFVKPANQVSTQRVNHRAVAL